MKRPGGFSLIELLVAMTLLGIVTLLGHSGLRLGMNYWRSAQALADEQQQNRAVHNFLERQLTGALRRSEAFRQPGQGVLRGTTESVRLIAPLAAQHGRGGLYEITLFSRASAADPARKALILGYRPLQQSISGAAMEQQQQTLLDNLSELEWEYFGRQVSGGAASWYRSWLHPDLMPLQIRLSYTDPQPQELLVLLPLAVGAADG